MPQFLFGLALLCADAYAVRLEDRTTAPSMAFSDVEVVATLSLPPANIAVSPGGRVFFTFLPQAYPRVKVAELVGSEVVPYPRKNFGGFDTVLSIRIDRQNRLWVLDFGSHGYRRPKILAFDLTTNELVHEYHFPRSIAPTGSLLNDLQIDPLGRYAFITDTSIVGRRPALVIYSIEERRAWRVLEGQPSVGNGLYNVYVNGRRFNSAPGVPMRFGADPIALSRDGSVLYFGPLNAGMLYRIATDELLRFKDNPSALSSRVKLAGKTTMSDGMTTDDDGRVYLTDIEHSAIVRWSADGRLETLIKDDRLRWPDGFSFASDGWLYFTGAALSDVWLKSPWAIQKLGSYFIYRFRPNATAYPGH